MGRTLADRLAEIEDEYAAACAAPLSQRRALLVAVLLDAFAGRVFAERRGDAVAVLGAQDLPAFRERLAARSPALATIFDLCGMAPGAPRLETAFWPVSAEELAALPVEDFMVALYNGQAVQRVQIVLAESRRVLAHEVLDEGLAFWREMMVVHASPSSSG